MGLFSKRNKGVKNPAADAESAGAASGNAAEVTLQNGQTYPISNSVDCLGDSCPRPQLMTKKALSAAISSDVVEVLVDNPTSMEALPPMCPGLDATHLETVSSSDGWRVYIQKG